VISQPGPVEGHLQTHLSNGKVCVGPDRTDTLNYMGSMNSALIEFDFPAHDREARVHYSPSEEILWESETATDAEVSEVEVQSIKRLGDWVQSRWPRWVPIPQEAGSGP
jgi:hypothetical protein